jgi:hypothetical protein
MKIDHNQDFRDLITSFCFVLGYNESLNKTQFIVRLRQSFCLASDERVNWFITQTAVKANYNSITRSMSKGIIIS